MNRGEPRAWSPADRPARRGGPGGQPAGQRFWQSNGQIANETRTVTGVTSGIPATGWYLNLHEGDSNNILKNGQPSIFFRPLLCQNL